MRNQKYIYQVSHENEFHDETIILCFISKKFNNDVSDVLAVEPFS